MRSLLLPLALTTLVACSSESSEPTTTADTGGVVADSAKPADTGAADDTAIDDTGSMEDSASGDVTIADAAADTTTADTTTADTTATDSAKPDTATVDTGTPPTDSGAPGPGNARIHEVYVDRNLEGDKVEFVEISAPVGTPLKALWLRVLDKSGAPVFNLALTTSDATMPAGGLWVVGTAGISNVNQIYSLSAWGLPNDGGSIQLTRNDGAVIELVDVVGYGAAPATTATEPKKTLEGAAATLPASGSTGKTLGRKSIPGDTDNNSADFCTMNATPGAANGACL